MPTANELYFDAQVQHADLVEDLKTGIVLGAMVGYNKSEEVLRSLLYERIGPIEERGTDLSPKTERALNNLHKDIYEARAEVYTELETGLEAELVDLAQYEAEYHKEAIETAVPFETDLSFPEGIVLAGVVGLPFRGKVLNRWVGELQEAEVSRTVAEIRIAIQDGDNTDQVVRRVIGTKTNRFKDGILNISRNHISTVARTAVAHVTQAAKETFYKINPAIQRVLYSAILDGRTTLVCIGLDGKLYPIGIGPRPPQHPNCRSQTFGVIDAQSLIGNRTYVTDTRTPDKRRIDFRRLAREENGESVWRQMGKRARSRAISRQRSKWADQAIGKVPRTMKYPEWFATQPDTFQLERLGPSRFKLYKEGVGLNKLTSRGGRTYTLKELKVKEKEAFERAMIDKSKN